MFPVPLCKVREHKILYLSPAPHEEPQAEGFGLLSPSPAPHAEGFGLLPPAPQAEGFGSVSPVPQEEGLGLASPSLEPPFSAHPFNLFKLFIIFLYLVIICNNIPV
jgi:hypothetical protein